MIKFSKYILGTLVATLLLLGSCTQEEYKLGTLVTPANVAISYEIVGVDAEFPYGDGSGVVNFTATADNEITFYFKFGDGKDDKIAQNGTLSHQFSEAGVNTYNVTVVAVGTGGISSSKSVSIEVFSSFEDPEALQFLTGGASKSWYWAADQPGHLGLGPNDQVYENGGHAFASWYNAAAFEKDGSCLYQSEFVFANVDGKMTFENINATGQAFVQGIYATDLGLGDEGCYDWDIAGVKNVSFSPSASIATIDGGYRGTSISFSDGGFMGFYCGSSEYEIISVTNNLLKVRVVQTNNPLFAWYHTFTSVKPGATQELDVEYTELKWADEFDTNGAVDATSWTYDLGAGGWGNGEVQTYTNDAANSSIADGILKITAKKEGASYTSARINTKGKYDFKYGRVDVRAKLPVGGGTWPAIWMLGANQDAVGWPACGEIDIMEGIGNNPGFVQGALHTPSSNGDTQNKGNTTVADASTEFHVYSMNWSANQISFLVDGEIFYTYNPEVKDGDTWPFDANQFLILNVAMGGTLGGTIDPAFVESSMEIDYVRVYQ